MTSKEELLVSFDEVWSHKWESLDSALKDVTEDEARYQHPSYAQEPNELHHSQSGTILWHLVHLAHCYRHYAPAIKDRPIRPPEPDAPRASTLEEATKNLQLYRRRLREVIESLSDNALEEKMGNGESVAQFVRSIIRHDAWHGGQIALAKRLYRVR